MFKDWLVWPVTYKDLAYGKESLEGCWIIWQEPARLGFIVTYQQWPYPLLRYWYLAKYLLNIAKIAARAFIDETKWDARRKNTDMKFISKIFNREEINCNF
jgi:hypothetical protein